jgi:hypothetical protein
MPVEKAGRLGAKAFSEIVYFKLADNPMSISVMNTAMTEILKRNNQLTSKSKVAALEKSKILTAEVESQTKSTQKRKRDRDRSDLQEKSKRKKSSKKQKDKKSKHKKRNRNS